MRRAALLLALVACDEPARLTAPGVLEGAVLHARGYEAAGASMFRTWFDTALGFECRFEPAVDGEYRCLPTWQGGYAIHAFLDAACSQAAVVRPACATDMFVAGDEQPTTACEGAVGRPVYLVEAPRAEPAYFELVQGVCVPRTAGSGEVVAPRGGEVAATAFVRAKLGITLDVGARLSLYGFVSDDGAREPLTAWDRDRVAECTIDPVTKRCEPYETADLSRYSADASCSIAAATSSGSLRQCIAPSAVVAYDQAGDDAFWEIGAALATAYSTDGGTCGPASPSGVLFYAIGPELPDTAFEETVEARDGSGQVQAVRYTSADGRTVGMDFGFRDTGRGDAKCFPTPMSDGVARCTPGVGTSPYFTDAACSDPVIRGFVPEPVLIRDPGSTVCAPRYLLNEPGEIYVGPLYHWESYDGGNCVQAPDDPGNEYRRLGAPITDLPVVEPR